MQKEAIQNKLQILYEQIFDSHVISTWIKNTVAKQQMITDSAIFTKIFLNPSYCGYISRHRVSTGGLLRLWGPSCGMLCGVNSLLQLLLINLPLGLILHHDSP